MKKIKKLILPLSFIVALFLTVLNFIACEKDPPVGDGTECSNCNVDADCKDGMYCAFFSFTSMGTTKAANKCAYSSSTTCPI